MSDAAREGAAAALGLHHANRGDLARAQHWLGVVRRTRVFEAKFGQLQPDAGESRAEVSAGPLPVAKVHLSGEWLAPVELPMATALEVFVADGAGGHLPAATRLLDDAKRMFAPELARIEAKGWVASAHAFLLAGFHGHRAMHAGATLLFHGPTIASYGDAARLRRDAAELERLERDLAVRLAHRAGMRVSDALRIMRAGEDAEVSADLALELSLVDEVISGAVVAPG